MSQETTAFTANVLLDGVKIGEAQNNGHGGCNTIYPPAAYQKVEEVAKTMPDYEIQGVTMKMDADLLLCTLIERHEGSLQLKKMMKTKIVTVKGGQIFAMIFRTPQDYAVKLQKEKAAGLTTLNDLPFEQALNLFMQS